MNTVTTSNMGVSDIANEWFTDTEREFLLSTLHTAAAQANSQKHTILASCVLPCSWDDALRVFAVCRVAGLTDCFFWEHPTAQHALVGTGIATTIETHGTTSLEHAAADWRTLMSNALVKYLPGQLPVYGNGPTFFGGFAFDPQQQRTELWANFPAGLLILPDLLFSYAEGQVALTLNSLVHPHENIKHRVSTLIENVVQLRKTLAQMQALSLATDEHTIDLVVQDIQVATQWKDAVVSTAQAIREGVYEKVVLARSVRVQPTQADEHFDITTTLQRLRQLFPQAYVFAFQRGQQFFVGATPERLVQAQDGQIQTMALAGSARRGSTEQDDRRIGDELLSSDKNKLEHAIVVNMVRQALSEHCTEVHVSHTPHLLRLNNVQHLETPITGYLRPGHCILDVMANLHPTPAVGGVPREAALTAIRETEQLERGWYAGPLGWIGAEGHGEFAVALRSGLVEHDKATLFAGCGIVADSDPEAEYTESCLKLQAMLRGLGGKRQE